LDDAKRLEDYAVRYGRSYDAYLVTEPGWDYFWSGGRRGVVALARQGRFLFSAGGLLAPSWYQEDLLGEVVEHATARRLPLAFLNIAEEQLPLFRKFAFQVTKWGEEALVDLAGQDWTGKRFEWVRRQVNYCQREGLVLAECSAEAMSPPQWKDVTAEVVEVSEQFLGRKPQSGEIRLLQGGFDPTRLGRKRLFVVRAQRGAGRVEGFAACNPCAGGRTWVLETYRQRTDAVRGTTAFMIHEIVERLKSEDVERFSLCLLPGLRCRQPMAGDSALARWGLVWGTQRFNLLFDAAGAYHFKSRFRPRFENRYLCVRPRMSIAAAAAFLRLVGVLDLDVGKLGRLALQRWRKRAARATLRTPER
jgi:phosphatidylglycerol lysyltransferase